MGFDLLNFKEELATKALDGAVKIDKEPTRMVLVSCTSSTADVLQTFETVCGVYKRD